MFYNVVRLLLESDTIESSRRAVKLLPVKFILLRHLVRSFVSVLRVLFAIYNNSSPSRFNSIPPFASAALIFVSIYSTPAKQTNEKCKNPKP